MDIIGLIRVRNEEHIIADTLDHMGGFCTGGVFVYDDASTDDTPEICGDHDAVRLLIRGKRWGGDVDKAPSWVKGAALEAAQRVAGPKDWLVSMDADERIEFDFDSLYALTICEKAVRMKLFDFYVTVEDEYLNYWNRRWLGPEYRRIIMAFRALPTLFYYAGREVVLGTEGDILDRGYVRHYGKAISVDAWERKCRYYAENYPPNSPRARKWAARKGKAVHTVSDFGLPLIEWADRETKGVALTPEIERREKR